MKILCFGRFYDDIPGGMQRHVEHLFAALRSQVDYVHLVPSRNYSAARFMLHGVPVVRMPSISLDGSLAISPHLILKAKQLHREYQFDLIFFIYNNFNVITCYLIHQINNFTQFNSPP